METGSGGMNLKSLKLVGSVEGRQNAFQERVNDSSSRTGRLIISRKLVEMGSFCLRHATTHLSICLIILVAMSQLAVGALFTNAQYSQGTICDSSRLIRCQQDVLRDMQTVSLNAASIQYPINGPPYSPKQQLVNPSTCRLVRSNLDCLLVTTPACYDQGYQTAQNTDIILRAKRFLEQNNCNEPDSTWQSTLCYRSPEIRSCEERYGFFSNGPTAYASSNVSLCLSYHAYKTCVETHLRYSCKVHEMDMANEYLIDRASDLAWRCPINNTLYNANYVNPYQLNNRHQTGGAILSPSLSHYNNLGAYDTHQRPIPTYVGSRGENINLFGSSREQLWEQFRNPVDGLGISRYPSSGSGEVFGEFLVHHTRTTNYRLINPNQFDTDMTSDCPIKAAPYVRECDSQLTEQLRPARDSRDGNELQRRLCCPLYQYRDCLSRVVLDRCADSTPTAVEILMGTRRREMTITCRGFNRDICSGAVSQTVLSLTVVIAASILASLFTFKHSISGNNIAL